MKPKIAIVGILGILCIALILLNVLSKPGYQVYKVKSEIAGIQQKIQGWCAGDPAQMPDKFNALRKEMERVDNLAESLRNKIPPNEMDEIDNALNRLSADSVKQSITCFDKSMKEFERHGDKKLVRMLKSTVESLKTTSGMTQPENLSSPSFTGEAKGLFDNAMATLKKAWLRDDKALEQKAVEKFKIVIKKAPACVPAYMTLALIFAYQEKFAEADGLISKAVKLDPQSTNKYDEYGDIDDFRKNFKKMKPLPFEYPSKEKNLRLHLRKKHYIWKKDLGEKAFNELMQIDKKATEYHEQNELDLALQEYQKMLQIYPECDEAYEGGALIYEHQKQDEKAFEMYKKILQINPNSVLAHDGLGWYYKEKGLLKEALKEFQKIVERYPKIGIADIARGNIDGIKLDIKIRAKQNH